MARGRPPKPLEQIAATARDANHKANGTEIARMEVVPDRTVPVLLSSTITGRGVEEWEKVWTAGFWLKRDQDYHWVEMIAQAYSDIEEWRREVKIMGLTAKGYNGQVVANPLIKEIRVAEQTIQKCLQVLGFSPTDRARLAITEAKARNAVLEFLDREAVAPS